MYDALHYNKTYKKKHKDITVSSSFLAPPPSDEVARGRLLSASAPAAEHAHEAGDHLLPDKGVTGSPEHAGGGGAVATRGAEATPEVAKLGDCGAINDAIKWRRSSPPSPGWTC